MKVDGVHIANRIYDSLRKEIELTGVGPRLGILTCSPNFETEKYLALKKKKAAFVGIDVNVTHVDIHATTEEVIQTLKELTRECDGIVVQLPLPSHIDTDAILEALPSSHDVDALGSRATTVLSPVVGAIQEILKEHEVPTLNQHVVVIGSGRLVGLPASKWFMENGAAVSVVTKDTADISFYTRNADIIVCGAGVPNLITPDMVKEGVVILDAGTSEDGGILRGDVHPECEEKASLFTPVPGGIGPITIAILLQNVVKLAKLK